MLYGYRVPETLFQLRLPLDGPKLTRFLTRQLLFVAECLIDVISRFGVKDNLLHDQGREFNNQLNDAIRELFGIKKCMTSPYHPQTNGLTERYNQTLIAKLTAHMTDRGDDWETHLRSVMIGYRWKVQCSSKFTPFELMFGVDSRFPYELDSPITSEDLADPIWTEETGEEIEKRMGEIELRLKNRRQETAPVDLPSKRWIDFGAVIRDNKLFAVMCDEFIQEMKMLANALKRKKRPLAPFAAWEVEEQMDEALEFELVSEEEQIRREERRLAKRKLGSDQDEDYEQDFSSEPSSTTSSDSSPPDSSSDEDFVVRGAGWPRGRAKRRPGPVPGRARGYKLRPKRRKQEKYYTSDSSDVVERRGPPAKTPAKRGPDRHPGKNSLSLLRRENWIASSFQYCSVLPSTTRFFETQPTVEPRYTQSMQDTLKHQELQHAQHLQQQHQSEHALSSWSAYAAEQGRQYEAKYAQVANGRDLQNNPRYLAFVRDGIKTSAYREKYAAQQQYVIPVADARSISYLHQMERYDKPVTYAKPDVLSDARVPYSVQPESRPQVYQPPRAPLPQNLSESQKKQIAVGLSTQPGAAFVANPYIDSRTGRPNYELIQQHHRGMTLPRDLQPHGSTLQTHASAQHPQRAAHPKPEYAPVNQVPQLPRRCARTRIPRASVGRGRPGSLLSAVARPGRVASGGEDGAGAAGSTGVEILRSAEPVSQSRHDQLTGPSGTRPRPNRTDSTNKRTPQGPSPKTEPRPHPGIMSMVALRQSPVPDRIRPSPVTVPHYGSVVCGIPLTTRMDDHRPPFYDQSYPRPEYRPGDPTQLNSHCMYHRPHLSQNGWSTQQPCAPPKQPAPVRTKAQMKQVQQILPVEPGEIRLGPPMQRPLVGSPSSPPKLVKQVGSGKQRGLVRSDHSIFDFKDSESDSEMPVLEKQGYEPIKRKLEAMAAAAMDGT
ncbi:unnamed protein product [Darwinula stevensoni]|uniref:Integrase catalytic domain-containing protein n=1 Tax=Darwinula stevensoni TaxID=69355 RepID=A0A7R8XE09_9CRUS|nr:unnamed protein product [Darwinula stevensoni]CAG0895318.1 unnamed protein product [Darwinula stevensoni]